MEKIMKIGQEVKFKNDFMIETIINKVGLQVKEGDKALVTKNGLKILNGEARGKITSFQEGEQIKGYDYSNIAKIIFRRLNGVFAIENYLDDEEISVEEFLEEIEDVLIDIL